MEQWIVAAALGVPGVLTVVLVVALVRTRRRTRAEIASARAETAALRDELQQLLRGLDAPPKEPEDPKETPEYRITGLGGAEQTVPVPEGVDRALFADLVLRETVVRAAGLAHGVRRALTPESRNRIRFEVRREVRRSRKQRRADRKEARREWAARGRSEGSDDEFAA